MTTSWCLWEARTIVEPHLMRLRAARQTADIVRAAQIYLGSWSEERIEKLRSVDGGCGPFGPDLRPRTFGDVVEIARMAEALGRHRLALRDNDIDPGPELLELELYLSFARQIERRVNAVAPSARAAMPRIPGYVHWSDQRDAAA